MHNSVKTFLAWKWISCSDDSQELSKTFGWNLPESK